MLKSVLHVLSQRPGRTGSGVMLDSIVRCAQERDWEQHVIVGTPADDPSPQVGDLPEKQIHPLAFSTDELPFALPGMSDVMPYVSSRFSALSGEQIAIYQTRWKKHIAEVVDAVRPTVIHSHHIWIVSSLLKDVVPDIPVVTTCHATGLRQMELCPHLAEQVRLGCSRNERFVVVQHGHAESLAQQLAISPRRIDVLGGGFREELFHMNPSPIRSRKDLLFAGKLSFSKGLPQLLDVFEQLVKAHPEVQLHVAGSGSGQETDDLQSRMAQLAPQVLAHGQVGQAELAELMRASHAFVLPSFYEGLPLVLVEAAACGCRLVSTDLPGVRHQLSIPLVDLLHLVPLPRMRSVDIPKNEDLPIFKQNLLEAIEGALSSPSVRDSTALVAPFTWSEVFRRVESIWEMALAAGAG